MAGHNGRELVVSWDSVTLVGMRSKGITFTNDHVDVTNDDDGGWRTLLPVPGLRSVEISAGLIVSDAVLITEITKTNITGEPLAVVFPPGGDIQGTFLLSSFEVTGEHDGAVEGSATFMSTGAVSYTP